MSKFLNIAGAAVAFKGSQNRQQQGDAQRRGAPVPTPTPTPPDSLRKGGQ